MGESKDEPEGGKLYAVDHLRLLATRLGVLSSHASNADHGQLHSPCKGRGQRRRAKLVENDSQMRIRDMESNKDRRCSIFSLEQ